MRAAMERHGVTTLSDVPAAPAVSKYKIVVTGDVIAESKLAMSQVRQGEHHVTVFDTASYMRRYSQAVGAASISEIIRRTIAGLPSISQRHEPCPELLSRDSWEFVRTDERYWGSYVTCEQVPRNGAGGDVAWRIKQKIGFDRKDPADSKEQLVDLSPDDTGHADLVIVNQSVGSEQAQYGFMGDDNSWPPSLREPLPSTWLLIEWSRPRIEWPYSDTWDRLVERFHGRVVAVVTAEDLRLAGIRMSRGISWERTLTELFQRVRELWTCDPRRKRAPLRGCAQLVVSFGTSGAAIFTGPADRLRAKLIYDPRFLEDSWDKQFEGTMSGFTRCLTAGIALEMICKGRGFTVLDGDGAKAGVIAARRILETGFIEIGRDGPRHTELPKDLRFPSSVAARVLRSAVAAQHIVATVDKAATELRASLCKTDSFRDLESLTNLVKNDLETQHDVHFDEKVLTKEVARIYADWELNDPLPTAPARDKNEAIEREEKRKARLIERIMGFISPDQQAIADAKALRTVTIDVSTPLDGWSILEQELPNGTDGKDAPNVSLLDRVVGLLVDGRRETPAPEADERDRRARKILHECRKIVEYGDSNDLSFPTLRIGKLFVPSRAELEGVTSVREVIKSYIAGNVRPPLSIAVFGQPGSGKSFAIKELAKNISSGRYSRVEDRTFNLSQFNSPEALAVALQQVRDLGLSGVMPLVFWDEFDTRFEAGMGWLRYFLAPMQDGKYQDGSAVYYIGRAIFVFAGGTHATMEEFIAKAKTSEKGRRYTEEATAAKLPDFVSRLKGFIDIPTVDYAIRKGRDRDSVVIDAPTAMRRAKLLRNILEDADAKLEETIPHDEGVYGAALRKRLNIDLGVLGAFLRVQSFRYGARSMDAIVKMSALTGKNRYDRSSLPPDEQLNLHVDARSFIALANAEWPVYTPPADAALPALADAVS